MILTNKLYPTLKLMWCHNIIYVRQDWNAHTVVRSHEYVRDYKRALLKHLHVCTDTLWHHVHSQSGTKFRHHFQLGIIFHCKILTCLYLFLPPRFVREWKSWCCNVPPQMLCWDWPTQNSWMKPRWDVINTSFNKTMAACVHSYRDS